MKKIKMLKTTNGSDDGIHVKGYEAGKTYDVGESLARAFVRDMKVAVEVILRQAQDDPELNRRVRENKDAGGSPENKSVKADR